MKHLENALRNLIPKDREISKSDPVAYMQLHRGSHSIAFTIQDEPIKEVGVNGCQAVDMLVFVKELFKSLNNDFPCRENSLTIIKLEEAIFWQKARTEDREKRGVEGRSEK